MNMVKTKKACHFLRDYLFGAISADQRYNISIVFVVHFPYVKRHIFFFKYILEYKQTLYL